MKTYQQKIFDYLDGDGWDVISWEIDNVDWWADEIWELKSVWSPKGVLAYITFLVDPLYEGNREKGQAVWGIGCSKLYPSSRSEAESGGTIGFGKAFKNDMLGFGRQIEALRHE